MKLNFSLFGYEIGVRMGIRKVLKEPITGITNRTQDGYYVPFLDYDSVPIEWVIEEIKELQRVMKLGELHIFRSSEESFHVVGFDKLTFKQYKMLLDKSSCDEQYKKVPFVWGKKLATLRISEKKGIVPQFFTTITPNHKLNCFEISQAHYHFFTSHHNEIKINIIEGYLDGNEEIILARYKI